MQYTVERPADLFGLLGLVPDPWLADACGLSHPSVRDRRKRQKIPTHKARSAAARGLISAVLIWSPELSRQEAACRTWSILEGEDGMSLGDFLLLANGIERGELMRLVARRRAEAVRAAKAAAKKGPKA